MIENFPGIDFPYMERRPVSCKEVDNQYNEMHYKGVEIFKKVKYPKNTSINGEVAQPIVEAESEENGEENNEEQNQENQTES